MKFFIFLLYNKFYIPLQQIFHIFIPCQKIKQPKRSNNNLRQMQESTNEMIQIQNNTEAIQYYQYLRSIMEINQLSYWIGNPSVQIISGKILLQPLKPIRTIKQPQNYQLYLQQIEKSNIKCGNTLRVKQSQVQVQVQVQSLALQSQRYENGQINEQVSRYIVQSKCLILLGIPNSKSPIQVIQTSCISQYLSLITQIRVIKTIHIKYYGMLLFMNNVQDVGLFFNQIFANQYNGLEIQRILLRKIYKISLSFTQLNTDGPNNQMMLLRQLTSVTDYVQPENVFMTYHYQKRRLQYEHSNKLNQNQDKLNQDKASQDSSQVSPLNELVCAICFQDCNQQVISILCGHYFHLTCLDQWSENICPLCRYHQQPPIIKFCDKCNLCEGLWVCLICGSRLCCGVHNNILGDDSHIYDHFKTTGHSLSMELQTKFLFDAKIPAFLHQKFYRDLIQHRQEQTKKMSQKDPQISKKNKIKQQIQQYESQVSEQMKRQRLYFEQQINKSIKKHRQNLSNQRDKIQIIRSQVQVIQKQQKKQSQLIKQFQILYQSKQKQLQITKMLIKMKESKVQQSKNEFLKYNNYKLIKLKQLEIQIKQKKQQIINYRKNLIFKQKIQQTTNKQSINGDIIMMETKENKPYGKKKRNK